MRTIEVFELVAELCAAALVGAGMPTLARRVRRLGGQADFTHAAKMAGLAGLGKGSAAWVLHVLEAASALRLFSVVGFVDGETDRARDARWLKGAPALIETLVLAYEGAGKEDALRALYGAELVVGRP